MPEELTDEAGEIVWECSYQLWGKPIQEIAHREIQQNLRYQGQYLDRETGLHYNTFRYYDPDIGRFTQPDPIGLLGGINLYQYAPNALMWIDPWGLTCITSKPKKVVNSNLPHAIQRGVERKVYPDRKIASDSLKDLGNKIEKTGFPSGTIPDSAHIDRVLVPAGNNGMVVYQIAKNGTAKLKTVLNKLME